MRLCRREIATGMPPDLDVKIGDRLRIVEVGGPDGAWTDSCMPQRNTTDHDSFHFKNSRSSHTTGCGSATTIRAASGCIGLTSTLNSARATTDGTTRSAERDSVSHASPNRRATCSAAASHPAGSVSGVWRSTRTSSGTAASTHPCVLGTLPMRAGEQGTADSNRLTCRPIRDGTTSLRVTHLPANARAGRCTTRCAAIGTRREASAAQLAAYPSNQRHRNAVNVRVTAPRQSNKRSVPSMNMHASIR